MSAIQRHGKSNSNQRNPLVLVVSGQTQPTASTSNGLTGDHLVNKQLDEIEQQKVECNSTQNHFIQQMEESNHRLKHKTATT